MILFFNSRNSFNRFNSRTRLDIPDSQIGIYRPSERAESKAVGIYCEEMLSSVMLSSFEFYAFEAAIFPHFPTCSGRFGDISQGKEIYV